MSGASPSPSKKAPDCTAKLVLLGESAVGKSSIALRFVRREFVPNQEATIGAAFLARSVSVPNGTVKLEIWDTAGQERYRSLAPMYYRGASGALVVYDITSGESLRKAMSWIKELRSSGDPNIAIVLVGNKCDLDNMRQVPTRPRRPRRKSECCSSRRRRRMGRILMRFLVRCRLGLLVRGRRWRQARVRVRQ